MFLVYGQHSFWVLSIDSILPSFKEARFLWPRLRCAGARGMQDDPSKYYAVRCETCKADVGLLDMDGIFHLFHVLESLA